jgi:uncharacterized protein (DUF1501 family)
MPPTSWCQCPATSTIIRGRRLASPSPTPAIRIPHCRWALTGGCIRRLRDSIYPLWVAGFSEEIGPAGWRDTVVVVISEFGRTFRENGDHGTDHGHGSVYWVMGGGINGGRILGEQVKVDQVNLFQNRDYPVLTDYRAMFAGLFQRMFGLEQPSVQRIFAGVHPAELGLV